MRNQSTCTSVISQSYSFHAAGVIPVLMSMMTKDPLERPTAIQVPSRAAAMLFITTETMHELKGT